MYEMFSTEKQAEIVTKDLLRNNFNVTKNENGYCITRNSNLISKDLDIKTFVTVAYAVLLTKFELKEIA